MEVVLVELRREVLVLALLQILRRLLRGLELSKQGGRSVLGLAEFQVHHVARSLLLLRSLAKTGAVVVVEHHVSLVPVPVLLGLSQHLGRDVHLLAAVDPAPDSDDLSASELPAISEQRRSRHGDSEAPLRSRLLLPLLHDRRRRLERALLAASVLEHAVPHFLPLLRRVLPHLLHPVRRGLVLVVWHQSTSLAF